MTGGHFLFSYDSCSVDILGLLVFCRYLGYCSSVGHSVDRKADISRGVKLKTPTSNSEINLDGDILCDVSFFRGFGEGKREKGN